MLGYMSRREQVDMLVILSLSHFSSLSPSLPLSLVICRVGRWWIYGYMLHKGGGGKGRLPPREGEEMNEGGERGNVCARE